MNNINTTLNSLVNSDLGLKQQGANLKPNNTKDIKEPIKEGSSLINEAISEDETLELGIKKIVNKLLDSIKASKDLNQLGENAKNINISKNIAEDLKELKSILSKDKDLEVFVKKLDNLLNTKMQDSKALFQALNNSGIFLESKLRANLNEQVLPQSFFRLISFMKNIKTSELKSEIFKLGQEKMDAKESLLKLENFINEKLENKGTNTNNSIIKTFELLKNARAYLQKNNEPLKLIEVANKLESKINNEIKNLINIEVKNDKLKTILPKLASLKSSLQDIKNIAKELVNNPANMHNNYKKPNGENNILNKLENIKEILKNNHEIFNKLSDINKNLNEKVEIKQENTLNKTQENKTNTITKEDIKEQIKLPQNKEEIKTSEKPIIKTNDEIKNDLKALQEITKSQDIKEELKLISNPEIKQVINQNQIISNVLNAENLSLQNKIENLTRLLSANLKNEESFKNYVSTNELKGLKTHLNQAKKDMDNISPRNNEHISKAVSNDAKAILLQTSKMALAKDNKVAYEMSQKLLNQIELNQIISVANNEVNTYLPYSIDDLDESNISFRSDSEDRFYAQIKLKFKKLGSLNIMLGLNKDKYLDINMMIENDVFRQTLINHAKMFKKDLRKADLIVSNFFISKLRENKYEEEYKMNIGFDKKI
ncbi:hypothetical protein AVANS14531_01640 [Campylobacter sp. Cr9]|uniref:hypothetical protein n=1 Tax=unclassified Campylobacter TaxID=2593542 RepID=UPI001EFAC670|nr:hypothetical protein [Campylobacter sp. RM5004]MBZ7985040.1 hypothetical protein [Campylobacter sp. Cr9]ULO01641.1 hypothetical protein AVANS_1015 [Campylobacter sp. RM5004]